ncbi:MAG TPA: outer membrane beta-barrel protein [Steroidobacteraceae bacterium]
MGKAVLRLACAAALSIGAPGALLAATDPSTTVAAIPNLPDLLTSWGLTATGYVAASYYHSSGYNTFHEFDIHHDTFQLDQAGASIAYQPKEGFGALVDLIAGEDARIYNASENGTDGTFDIRQAYVQYATGPLTLLAGKYTTLAGEEYGNPTTNTNFSRSLLFFAEPLTHTGVRAAWAALSTLTLTAGVNNGWNTTSTSYGSKTAELGAAFTPIKQLVLNLQGYFGKVPGYDAQRSFIDFVGTYSVTDALSVALSVDWGKQQQHIGADLNWDGVAGYLNYALTSQWRISLRAECFNDKDGFNTGTAQKIKEGTVTVGFAPVKNFELRIESRYDKSDQPTFLKSSRSVLPGLTVETFDDKQSEFALQGVFKF